MAELHSNLFFKHKDKTIHNLFCSLVEICDLNHINKIDNESEQLTKFIDICTQINPDQGASLAKDFIKYNDGYGSESTWEADEGYQGAHFVDGSSGDDNIGDLVFFFYSLSNDLHVQAWGCGDDDPWEFWFKVEDGELVRKDDEPEYGEPFTGTAYDEEGDSEEVDLKPIYDWWHKDLPDGIKQGFCNEDEDDEEEEEEEED